MIALLDTSADLAECAAEIGLGIEVGQLLTPLTRFRNRGGGRFAIDNGAFSGLDIKAFRTLLQREVENRARCIFVAVPDVLGSARRTLEVFEGWQTELGASPPFWPLALVAQDGVEDLPIPWGNMAAVFIGGTDAFKGSTAARHVALAARALGKWVHVGRVNTSARLDAWWELADSFDGSGISQYSHMRRNLSEPTLFTGVPQ
jgi:hypothetical protein